MQKKLQSKKSNMYNWKTVIPLFIISAIIIFGIFLGLSAIDDELTYESSAATYSNKKKNIVLKKKKLVKLRKVNVIPTISPTISQVDIAKIKYQLERRIYQNKSIGRVLTPETFPKEEEISYYTKFNSIPESSYWGSVGTADPGQQLETGGKIWSDDWWKPLRHQDMIFNLPPKNYGDNTRSVANWWKVVDHFNLGNLNNARYQAANGSTFCNVALGDLTRAFGVWIPHWYKDKELLANNIYDQLLKNQKFWSQGRDEWVIIHEKSAVDFANLGKPVVMAIKNLCGKSGHVGLVAPNSDTSKIYLAQAGTRSGIILFEQKNFPKTCYTDPLFMVNIADYGDE